MSLNPALGHLYHDGNISDACTVLDAKEKVRTREINAREAKVLDKYACVLDRAKLVCKRQNEWEQLSVRKHLQNIKIKTPSLRNSLLVETEKTKQNGQRKMSSYQDRSFLQGAKSAKDGRKVIKVSPWSVYSQFIDYDTNRPDLRKTEVKSATATLGRYKSSSYKDDSATAKTENLNKKAEQITKSLHNLYTKSVERKVKEKDMTVLDILNRNSKDELEKALFVLRGTPTGEAIEDILKDKETVIKPQNGKYETNVSKSVDIPHKLSNDNITKPTEGDTAKLPSEKGSQSSVFDDKYSNGDEMSIRPWSESDTQLSVNEVFERDDSFMMSSVMANPSETDAGQTTHRWRDIFKAPELWRQNSRKVKIVKVKPKPVSLVTISGRYRQTMLK